MAHAYTPGLRVANRTVVRKRRILPLKGKVLKQAGDSVRRDEVVARTELPGKVTTVNIVNRLGITPQEIERVMLKKEGDAIEANEIIAETKGLWGWFKSNVESPIKGTVESISNVTGQVILREPPQPVEVVAYLNGKIVEVIPEEGATIETQATFIQGIFGVGGEVWGPLRFAVNSPEKVLGAGDLKSEFKDAIVVGGAFASFDIIRKAVECGIKGLIIGGIQDEDLRRLLGYDLGVAITGTEKIGITIVLTEGFGEIRMADRSFNTLKAREGSVASISGATQIRAGVIRPEIIIPFDDGKTGGADSDEHKGMAVDIGSQIRVIRQPYFGKIGTVSALPHELRQIESETKARVLEVKFGDGKTAVIPRANIELIEE